MSPANVSTPPASEDHQHLKCSSPTFSPPGRAFNCTADAPWGCGLLIILDAEGCCRMRFTKDARLPHIHPHVRVPSALQEPIELGGGGSGVTLVKGCHPELGDVVLKHGGRTDTAEVFALATVAEELRARGESGAAAGAAAELRSQIPEFKFLYLSQEHLWNRSHEMWNLIKSSIGRTRSRFAKIVDHQMIRRGRRAGIRVCTASCREHGSADNVAFVGGCLKVYLDGDAELDGLQETDTDVVCAGPGRGYSYMVKFVRDLAELQNKHHWKVSLAQKAIGGASPTIAAKVLQRHELNGKTLDTLLVSMMRLMSNLKALTRTKEVDAASGTLKDAAARARESELPPSQVAPAVDAYVGFCIKKNFHEKTGRFVRLRDIGRLFANDELVFTKEETLPAQQLAKLLRSGSRMEEVFMPLGHDTDPLTGPTALDRYESAWRSVLDRAFSLQSSAATARVWTGGITDGGLHNMFLGAEGIWLFDLGPPSFVSLPAFLTKFLMSFFHILGMEPETKKGEDEDKVVEAEGKKQCGRAPTACARDRWVVRFEPQPDGRLAATSSTAAVLSSARAAFDAALERLVTEVFGGEAKVRSLLVQYVVLQLLSDAAFCLQRWQAKGGGSPPVATLNPQPLEKWLWRSLWDIYAASDVARDQERRDSP